VVRRRPRLSRALTCRSLPTFRRAHPSGAEPTAKPARVVEQSVPVSAITAAAPATGPPGTGAAGVVGPQARVAGRSLHRPTPDGLRQMYLRPSARVVARLVASLLRRLRRCRPSRRLAATAAETESKSKGSSKGTGSIKGKSRGRGRGRQMPVTRQRTETKDRARVGETRTTTTQARLVTLTTEHIPSPPTPQGPRPTPDWIVLAVRATSDELHALGVGDPSSPTGWVTT
jgi:hypothetical protein